MHLHFIRKKVDLDNTKKSCQKKAGLYRAVRVADGPITARYRFIKNASWELRKVCLGKIKIGLRIRHYVNMPVQIY